MPTMNVSLPAALAEFVEKGSRLGQLCDRQRGGPDGLRMLREERAVYEEKLAILRREIQIGLDEVNAGKYSDKTVMEILAEVQAEDEDKR